MKRVIYFGRKEDGYFVEETAHQYGCEVICSGYVASGNTILERTLSDNYEYAVIDVKDTLISPAEMYEIIRQIKIACPDIKIAMIGAGMSMTMAIIQASIEAGVDNLILSTYPTQIMSDCATFLEGKSNIDEKKTELNQPTHTIKTQPFVKINIERKTIGVAGGLGRTGTTTQAMQLCKYLQLKGKKVCYVEMNNNGFVDMVRTIFSEGVEENNIQGYITYGGVDMYAKGDNIDEILNYNYEYYVCDYGAYNSSDFLKTSYFEKNIKIMVLDVSPLALTIFPSFLDDLYPKKINYIFNLVPDKNIDDVYEMMEDRAKDTYIAGVSADMWNLNVENKKIYEKIIPITDESTQLETPTKKGTIFDKIRIMRGKK